MEERLFLNVPLLEEAMKKARRKVWKSRSRKREVRKENGRLTIKASFLKKKNNSSNASVDGQGINKSFKVFII